MGVVRFINLGLRRVRHLALLLRDLPPANQLTHVPNATSGAHVDAILRHNLDGIDARQAIGLSYMAEYFCSSSDE